MRFPNEMPGWILSAAVLTVVAYSVLVVPTTPGGVSEATYRLQAESLARDFDRTYAEPDRARFGSKNWPELDARIAVARHGEALHFQRPLPYSLALAPFVRAAPERGALVLNALILGALALGLALRLHRDSPRSAPYWSLALLAGTVCFAYARAALPELFLGGLLVAAYVLSRDDAPREELPQMAPKTSGAGRLAGRWLAVGALLALATLHEPLYAVCLPAFLLPTFRSRNEVAWASAIAAFALVLAGNWWIGGELFPGVAAWWPDTGLPIRSGDALADAVEWAARVQVVEEPELILDLPLTLWNGLYAFVGRHTGWIPCFLPLVLLAATAARVRWHLWVAMGLVLVGSIVLDPFNFAGGPEALGYRRLLPLALLAFFTVRPSISPAPAVVSAVLGALLLAPVWARPSVPLGDLRDRVFVEPLASILPYETSQRWVPASAEVFSRLLLARTANEGLLPGSAGDHFVLRAGREGELMIAAAEELRYLDFEFGSGAASELEVGGGAVENLLFRPGGGVTFRVIPKESRIRHRIWGRDDTHFLHMLTISMPSSEGQDQPFSLTGQAMDASSR